MQPLWIQVGLLLVSSPHWKWSHRMKAARAPSSWEGDHMEWIEGTVTGCGYVLDMRSDDTAWARRTVPGERPSVTGPWIPDMRDGATRGLALDLVRDLWNDQGAYARTRTLPLGETWTVYIRVTDENKTERSPHGSFMTEMEALAHVIVNAPSEDGENYFSAT